MLASSVLVLTALTVTGIFARQEQEQIQDDGYTLDFSQIEIKGDEKFGELAEAEKDLANADDALDAPMEVGSGNIKIPGLTEKLESPIVTAEVEESNPEVAEAPVEEAPGTPQYQFVESEGLLKPVSGKVLMPYSMDGGIYFATLDQYKYNPAVIISADENAVVASCAEGTVVAVYETAETGGTVVVDLGGGYEMMYSQLKNVAVGVGDFVGAGYLIGYVAAPTKYYTVEGSNLYLKMTKNGEPMNPEALFR